MKSIKLLLAIIGLVASVFCEAQINYQAVVRDVDNIPQVNQMIDIDVTVTQDGTIIYSEQHSSVPTGELGIVNLGIGSIDPVGFDELDWSLNNYEVQLSINGSPLPSTPIRSVPIAEFAKKSSYEAPIYIPAVQDITLTNSGGGIILGDSLNTHLSIDNNEILAKDHQDIASLYLQADGGNVVVHSNADLGTEFIIRDDGRVGLGTETPTQRLHLVTQELNTGIRLQTSGVSEYIQMNMATGLGGTSGYGYLSLGGGTKLRGNGRPSEFDGKVEVNCLQINGGCDITEPFESKVEFIEPGTVVIMTENGIVPSRRELDNRVVGVVSGANGIQKGMQLSQTELFENGIDIAIAGRVYVKTTGNVEIGDLLVSSETEGVAKAENDIVKAFGRSIGKALSVPDENGFVLMIVNLQ